MCLDSLCDLLGFSCLRSPFLLLLGSPFGTAGGTTVIPWGVYVPVLPPPIDIASALILRPAFYPLEEGGTNLWNMVPHPIVLESWPPLFGHIALPKMCERSRLWRALLLKGSATLLQKAFTAGARWSLYLSSLQKDNVLQCAGILQDPCAPWGP